LRADRLKKEHCLRRAARFDQRERFTDYVALYAELCGEANV